eukprot:m.87552 g.87552  ORF g.87552 m.87552 type:complete len:179 (+) comp26085_c0_seq1:164-700(+)
MAKRPRLVAFDLDGTVWCPDMYQLWGGGAPFKVVGDGTKELRDRSHQPVVLLGAIGEILHELQTDAIWADTKVAWVSCTDEPSWADECLKKFHTSGNVPIGTIAHSSQIYKSNKKVHFQRLREQYADVAYEDMIFFDNENGNIRNVSSIGVHSVFCPDGMTREVWNKGLMDFANKKEK